MVTEKLVLALAANADCYEHPLGFEFGDHAAEGLFGVAE